MCTSTLLYGLCIPESSLKSETIITRPQHEWQSKVHTAKCVTIHIWWIPIYKRFPMFPVFLLPCQCRSPPRRLTGTLPPVHWCPLSTQRSSSCAEMSKPLSYSKPRLEHLNVVRHNAPWLQTFFRSIIVLFFCIKPLTSKSDIDHWGRNTGLICHGLSIWWISVERFFIFAWLLMKPQSRQAILCPNSISGLQIEPWIFRDKGLTYHLPILKIIGIYLNIHAEWWRYIPDKLYFAQMWPFTFLLSLTFEKVASDLQASYYLNMVNICGKLS